MTDIPDTAAGEGFSSGLLSSEEIQELLAPLDVEEAADQQPVLVLATRPGDTERVIMHLMGCGVPVVPTETWDGALRRLESRRYVGIVATAETLEPDPVQSVEYLRTFHPELEVCVIVDPLHEVHAIDATVVVRPEMGTGLDQFLRILGKSSEAPDGENPGPSAQPKTRRELRVMDGVGPSPQPDVRKPPPTVVAGSGATGADAGTPRPDPLLAVQALLEARAAGEDMVAGLRRWAERDPAILGVAECHLDETEWRLRATAPVAGERHRMLLLLLDQLESPLGLPAEPATAGPFSLFPLFRSPRSCVALWHQDASASQDLLGKLRPLLPLIEALPENSEGESEEAVRERFIALLESRMRATDRGEGHLGVLLVEAPRGESPALLCRDLQSALRGGDWIEVVGRRLYVILDHPGKGTLAAIGARLRGLPASEQLRVVALAWDPSQGRAAALVGTAERLLEQGEVVGLDGGATPG